MGWHGIKTKKQGILFVYMIHLHYRTHYMKFENGGGDGIPCCMLGNTFSIADTDIRKSRTVHDLAYLEGLLADDVVVKTWEFQVTGAAVGSDGVRITVDRCGVCEITKLVAVIRKK